MVDVTITVNGIKHNFKDLKESATLLYLLREKLQLTGTKNGCNQGHCGACTVVMNGKAVKSCLVKVKKLKNADILTIEGISPKSPTAKLHPIQQAFIDCFAAQCGFCSPGIIMRLYALFQNEPNVDESQIKKELEKHLCRCTGMQPILDAALLAKKLMK